jgi:hypothetical protein
MNAGDAEVARPRSSGKGTLVGIAKMLARTTRIEFLIVTVGLLVLLFCSQPPQSGNAQVDSALPEGTMYSWPPDDVAPKPDENDLPKPIENIEPRLDTEPIPADDQQPPRMGSVDARNVGHTPYNDVMYGDVAIRWVWDGQKFVPRKVCVVQEKSGVKSVWGFDRQGKAVVSEVPAESAPTP